MVSSHLPALLRRYSGFTLELSKELKLAPMGGLRLLLLFSIFPIAQYFGAYYDNALILPGDAKGLLEHPGQWAIFLAPPILVLLAALAFRSLIIAIDDLPLFSADRQLPPSVLAIIREQEDAFALRGIKKKAFLALLMIVGILIAIRNYIQTSDAARIYGNDIFDSSLHPWGFLFTRMNNSFLYIFVFPILLFQIFLITIAAHRILSCMVREDALFVDFFNSDECGGLSRFGFINMLIMLMWGVIFGVIYADFKTHKETVLTLNLSLVLASILFVTQSIWGVYSIHKCVKKKKKEALVDINSRLNSAFRAKQDLRNVSPLMQLRSAVIGTSTFPYSRTVSMVVNVLRFAPPAVALFNLLVRP